MNYPCKHSKILELKSKHQRCCMNLKNFIAASISIFAFVLLSPFLLVIAFVTSLIWIPLVLQFSTTFAIIYFVVQKTPIGNHVKVFYLKDIKERFDACGGLQSFLLENLNNILCLVFPKLQKKASNYGYAVLNQDGKLISDIKVEFEDEKFPLQLYHYLATCFEKYKNLGKWTVLELECEAGGGIDYISRNLKARKAVGLTSNDRMAKFCQQTYWDNTKLEFHKAEMNNLLQDELFKGQNFDLILNVEGRSRFGFSRFQDCVQLVPKLLKPGGLFICADYGTVFEMSQMEKTLRNCGLNIYHIKRFTDFCKERKLDSEYSPWLQVRKEKETILT